MNAREIASQALLRPTLIAIQDPAMTFSHLYLATLYACYYLFFAAVPAGKLLYDHPWSLILPIPQPVFEGIYGMSTAVSSLIYLSIGVGIGISLAIYLSFYTYVALPQMKKNGPGPLEGCLVPALMWTWFVPAGLWIFGKAIFSLYPPDTD